MTETPKAPKGIKVGEARINGEVFDVFTFKEHFVLAKANKYIRIAKHSEMRKAGIVRLDSENKKRNLYGQHGYLGV